MPNPEEWREALSEIKQAIEEFSDRYFSFQWIHQPQTTPSILSNLAVQVLRKELPFTNQIVDSIASIQVKRKLDFWAETIELKEVITAALSLTIHRDLTTRVNLADFYENHPYRQNPEQLLVGLKVTQIDGGTNGTITGIVGTVGEHRQESPIQI